MTGSVINSTVRRLLARAAGITGATAALLATSALLAGPASAKPAEGWSDPDPVDPLFLLTLILGIPALLFLIITAAVYVPGLVRGERVAPGATGPQDQWLGGRRDAGEIAYTPTDTKAGALNDAEPDTADGGGSARW